MGSILTEEEDRSLRQYALYLCPDLGEDAYHIVVCDVIARGSVSHIRNIMSFFRVSIRWALYKLFRHEKSERSNIQAFINNDPIPMLKGFVPGDTPHITCRRGHEWKEETTAYIGSRRTCRICKREREARDARNYRKITREAI